ncbi:MAG: hypothetical protein ABIP06_00325 [Pyrinomonadaceae bacterium]
MEVLDNTEEKVLLDTEIELRDNEIKIAYKLKNKTKKPIYLFNVIWDFDSSGSYIFAPNSFYSCLRDDGTFVVAERILPLPKNKRVELKIVPFATEIEAGSDFSGDINIPVPATEYNPYFPKKNEDDEKLKMAESIVFTVEFVKETDGLEIKPAPLEGAKYVWHQDLRGKTETLSSNPKSITIQVKKRTDIFERF